MAVYYIDNVFGLDINDGLSENSPKKDYRSLELRGGDSVLFKCGSFYRGRLYNAFGRIDAPITYASYGEGEKPTFCGSVDMTDENMWAEIAANIWASDKVDDEVCNFIFDGGKNCGTLRWSVEELCAQGDFYDDCFAFGNLGKEIPKGHRVYLYSVGNPALVYKSIEAAVFGARCLAQIGKGLVFDGLRFINSGVHGIANGVDIRNCTVRNCDFEFIGGGVWNKELKIRFGNAVECWETAEDILVENCRFYDIYDSATTHQGSHMCEPAKNFIIRNNTFIKCGMAAYEQRDLLPVYAEFIGNTCIDAGEGFSKLGEVMPRRSEIYPEPMGHHVFLWRIENATEGGRLVIKDNVFMNAPYGTSIYSIISKDAEDLIELCGNNYATADTDVLANRFNGKNFKSFEEYRASGIEKEPKSEIVENTIRG